MKTNIEIFKEAQDSIAETILNPKMTELKLKTLKDLKEGIEIVEEHPAGRHGFVTVRKKDLKNLAIKWVKDLEENRYINGHKWTDGAIFIIEEMNNITSEDLKMNDEYNTKGGATWNNQQVKVN